MKIQEIYLALGISPKSQFVEKKISGIFNDARKVEKDSVFVAIPGVHVDGHNFIPDAIAKGASVLIVEDSSRVPLNFSGVVIPVGNSRNALDLLAGRYYRTPSEELFCVGVTGTNGKTSVTYILESLLNYQGLATGVIGTVDHHLLKNVWPTEMTTPDPLNLQKRLREFKDAGAKAVAMEVSSHALDQHRVDSVQFDLAIFTNLTRDHLDYHGDMAHYFRSKERLFSDLLKKSQKTKTFAVINVADEFGAQIAVGPATQKWTYGTPDADFKYQIQEMGFTFTRFQLTCPLGVQDFELPMAGEYNVRNAVAAIAAALAAGISLASCAVALKKFSGVPGRLQSLQGIDGISAFVDYAHTPDALVNVLLTLCDVRAKLKSTAQIWTVFGCGGDRDKGKRPLMAQAALKYSDFVYITSDNPRTEEPQDIISDILAGVQGADKHRVFNTVDRRFAIEDCIAKAKPGDVILIAGKGHEDYQIIGKTKTDFSDFQVAEVAFQKRGQR